MESIDHNDTSADESKLEFKRKLNRDPDKGFIKLSADGKVLVSSLRAALEDAKQKIMKLRDESDKKDDIIEEERSFRVALEDKMEKYLVDLYLNPNVNLELHQRLPRAKKRGILFERNGDEKHDAGSESSDVEVNKVSESTFLLKTESQIKGGHPTGAEDNDKITQRMADQDDVVPEDRQSMEQAALSSSKHHSCSLFQASGEGVGHQEGSTLHLNLETPTVPVSVCTLRQDQHNVSHVTRLLQEISVLKMENIELKTELKECRMDLEFLKENNVEGEGNKNTEVISALIEEVRRAEKEGERAVSELIKSANLDRDAALLELDHIRLKAARGNNTGSSNSQTDWSYTGEAEENDFIDSASVSKSDTLDIECDEIRIASLRMKKLLEKQKEIAKHQIATVIVQRDEALQKVNQLRENLVSLRASEFLTVTNRNLQAKLKITEKERDIAVRKLQLLSRDMDEVTLMYNLQKALLTDDVNIHVINEIDSSKLRNENSNKKSGMYSDKEVFQKAGEEKDIPTSGLEKQLKGQEKENLEKDKRIEQLEALVLRQRKKLNTLCAGPLLMDN